MWWKLWSEALFYKNIKNAFLFHGLVHSTVLPQVLQPQLLLISIFHSLFYPDERFLKAFSFAVYKNGSASGILREQAASTRLHYFVHCLWLLGINLTKGFLRNQEQEPTFVKESIKQNQIPWDLGEKRKNNEIPDPVFAWWNKSIDTISLWRFQTMTEGQRHSKQEDACITVWLCTRQLINTSIIIGQCLFVTHPGVQEHIKFVCTHVGVYV